MTHWFLMKPSPDRTALSQLIEQAKARPMTQAEMREQRRNYVRAEMGFGSDADEAAYAAALAAGDEEALARLKREADERMAAADRYFDEGDAL